MEVLISVALSIPGFSGLAGAVVTGSVAQDAAGKPAMPDYHAEFIRLDTNKDGVLVKSEARTDAMLAKHSDTPAINGQPSESKFASRESRHHAQHTLAP